MTVGQPEINLNSWGIRYVKVKQSPTAELDKEPKEGDKREFSTGGLSDLDASISTFPDRKEDSKGDKDSHIRTADQTEKEKELNRGGSPQSVTSVNEPLKEVEGHSESFKKPRYGVGSVATGATQGGKDTKTLNRQGKLSRSGSRPSGSAASHDSGIKDPFADKKRDQQGNPVNFNKPREGEGKPLQTQTSPKHENPVPKGGQSPKIKAALDYATKKAIMDMNIAILKCKTFKLKRIDYSGEDSQYGDENDHDARVDSLEPKSSNESSTTRIEDADGKLTEVQTGYKKWKKENEKKASNDVVAKAIELINEAYAQIGKGKNVEETQDIYRDEFDLIDQDNPDKGTEKDADVGDYKDTYFNKPQKWINRPPPTESTEKKETKTNKADSAYAQIGKDDIRGRHDDRSDDETPEPKFTWGCPESGCDFKTGDEDKVGSHVNSHDKDSKTNKADSAVTTGTEGTNNPVNAGKKDQFEKPKTV